MKKILLSLAFLIITTFCVAQVDYFNTILTIGHNFDNDISLGIGGRFWKDTYLIYEHGHNFTTRLQYNYISFGNGTCKSLALLKIGAKTEPFKSTQLNYFDYGVEYLWVLEKNLKKKICYGLDLTKKNGVGFKVGLIF
jgi:hypothetical protein